ncbi:haloacid dehalogenase [Oceanisphaera profunda]|uniref:Haloacid dehalogenase n=1 Tax=Oceanisphaera profunda TaxID=1416627 RepID=A0A1Y0D3K3_9GAMM|nr:HAD family hydrolase [Oceanisphaera profunda]ART82111.1 haloacid dehalogenase [Oceanisphaera profunda]
MQKFSSRFFIACLMYTTTSLAVAQAPAPADPLPSWNSNPTKSAIMAFVQRVTEPGTADFVPVPDRIATFDNDGTLWAEQPVYFQAQFAIDNVKDMAPDHPDWQTTEPYKSALAGDLKGVMATGKEGLVKLLLASHVGMTETQFNASVMDWLASAKHPTRDVPYPQMAYQPMLELLNYLRANDFDVYIVSGGGIDFMRVFAESVYGVPPENVVGSTAHATYEMRDGIPTIVKTGDLIQMNDNVEKPVAIYRHIGRRPIFAAGNSDGDMQMLEYTTIARNSEDTTPRLGILVHHDDAKREWAYDRVSAIGKLDQALDAAPQYGWHVISMEQDWRQIFPAEKN